jgi:hypothetical protein
MGWRDIRRDEAMQLGLIDRDTQVAPRMQPDFNAGLQAVPEVAPGPLRDAILSSLDAAGISARFVGDVLRFTGFTGNN